MGLRVLTILLLSSSLCYADIAPVKVDEIQDHRKLADKLNQIIYAINQQNREVAQSVAKVDTQFASLKTELEDANVIVKPVHTKVVAAEEVSNEPK